MKPLTVSRGCMGSPFTIAAYPCAPGLAGGKLAAAVGFAFAEIARVEDLLTDFRPSPFNEINEQAGVRPVKVTDEIMTLVELSLTAAAETGGAFDISCAPVGMLWREAFRKGLPPAPGEIERARALVGYGRIKINRARCEIYLPEKGMRISLGSIGKSYGVDRAFEVLKDLGVKNYFVNGAGDIRVSSAAGAARPWRVGIKNPFRADEAACGAFLVSRGAVVTSGDYERCMVYNGRRYHHILDARTSAVRDDISSVTVLDSTAVLANLSSTAVMAMGPEDGARFMAKRPGARAVFILPGGKVVRCNTDSAAKTEPALCGQVKAT